MFLSWSESLGLLKQREDTNILKNFPLSARRTIVSEVLSQLDDPDILKSLTTPTHVSWTIECLAQGFTLPMEEKDDVNIIKKCINTYFGWILGSQKPPGLVLKDSSFREMIGHLTLIFDSRPTSTEKSILTQSAICKDFLDVFLLPLLKQDSMKFSEDTWLFMLRSLFGIVDSIYVNSSKLSPNIHAAFCKAIGPRAFKVTLEILLRSGTVDEDIWKILVNLLPHWICSANIQHWTSVMLSLTLRSIALMYGPRCGGICASNFTIEWNEDLEVIQSSIAIEDSFVFFCWHRFLCLLPNLSNFDPRVHSTFFLGIHKLVSCYLRTIDLNPLDPSLEGRELPTINSIICIFDRWLFATLMDLVPEYEEGNSIAMRTLCELFCKAKTRPDEELIKSNYLGSFYHCLYKSLGNPLSKVTQNIYLYARNLFTLELNGSHMLLPSFLVPLQIFWKNKNEIETVVRNAALDFISTILCYPMYYRDSQLLVKPLLQDTELKPMNTFFDSIEIFFKILTLALEEENPRNIIKVFNLIEIFLTSIYENDFSLSVRSDSIFIRTTPILTILADARLNVHWKTGVIIAAYKCLGSLKNNYKFWGKKGPEICGLILKKLSEHIIDLSVPSEDCEIILNIILTLSEWLDTDPNILVLLDSTNIDIIIKAVVTAAGFQSTNDYVPAINVKNAAEYTLSKIICIGQFPSKIGPHRISSELDEIDILKLIGKETSPADFNQQISQNYNDSEDYDPIYSQYIRHFLLENSAIISLIDIPSSETSKGSVYIIIRDENGKFVWKADMNLADQPEVLSPIANTESVSICTAPFCNKHETENMTEKYHELLNYLSQNRADRFYDGSLINFTQDYIKIEAKNLQNTSFGLNEDICFNVPKKKMPYSGSSKFIYSRILLSHLGLCHIDNYKSISLIDEVSTLYDDLYEIDSIPERSQLSVAILKVTPQNKSFQQSIPDEDPGSPDYKLFLDSIGWKINIWEHTGYSGPLGNTKYGEYAVYYANLTIEIFFVVMNWIKLSKYLQRDDILCFKKNLVSNTSPILIVWNETLTYEPPKNFQINFFHLVIFPLNSGLFLIRTYTDGESNKGKFIGPLVDGTIIHVAVLGVLVRLTIISAYKYLFPKASCYLNSWNNRKTFIKSIAEKYSKKMDYDEFLTHLTTAKQTPGTRTDPLCKTKLIEKNQSLINNLSKYIDEYAGCKNDKTKDYSARDSSQSNQAKNINDSKSESSRNLQETSSTRTSIEMEFLPQIQKKGSQSDQVTIRSRHSMHSPNNSGLKNRDFESSNNNNNNNKTTSGNINFSSQSQLSVSPKEASADILAVSINDANNDASPGLYNSSPKLQPKSMPQKTSESLPQKGKTLNFSGSKSNIVAYQQQQQQQQQQPQQTTSTQNEIHEEKKSSFKSIFKKK